MQDFSLDPFGALSAVENAAQELHPILGNVTSFLVDDYQGLVHSLSDGDVKFYDNVSGYLNSIHENTNAIREWSEDVYNELLECRPGVAQPGIPTVTLDSLPEHVQIMYQRYSQAGWKGNLPNQTLGTCAGGRYRNDDNQLPSIDVNGVKISYREWDVNNKEAGKPRDSERFVTGTDGSVYYTDSHYGQSTSPTGRPPFVRIK